LANTGVKGEKKKSRFHDRTEPRILIFAGGESSGGGAGICGVKKQVGEINCFDPLQTKKPSMAGKVG